MVRGRFQVCRQEAPLCNLETSACARRKRSPAVLREYEHLTLARCLLPTPGDATGADSFAVVRSLLTRLDVAATTGGRAGTALEVAVLLALVHHRHGDTAAARAHLGRALHIGLPEGYARVFLDEGPDMVALLRDAIGVGAVPGELRVQVLELLSQAAPGTEPSATSPGPGGGSAAQGERTANGFVVEPLSGRERDVLRLLGTDLAGPDIARELVLSVNTVRTHTKNIYAKLGVNTRRAAVRRAHELSLLEGSGGP